jgi:hypothetical protein
VPHLEFFKRKEGTMPLTRLSVDDLPPEQLKKLGIKLGRKHAFSKETVCSWSLRVLAQLAGLSQDQRRRVLDHALKVNRL